MKSKIILLLLFSGFIVIDSFSQHSKSVHYFFRQEINPGHEMKSILDSVYPGIRFIVQSSNWDKKRVFSELCSIKEQDTNVGVTLRTLQFEGSFLNDSVFRYTPATLIKANILLDLAKRQRYDYYIKPYNISAGDIEVSSVFVDLKNEHSIRYMGVDSANRFLNYRAIVNLNTPNKIDCYDRPVHLTKMVYEFQIIEGVIQGYIVTGYDQSGNELPENFQSTTGGYSTRHARYYYDRLRKKKRMM